MEEKKTSGRFPWNEKEYDFSMLTDEQLDIMLDLLKTFKGQIDHVYDAACCEFNFRKTLNDFRKQKAMEEAFEKSLKKFE